MADKKTLTLKRFMWSVITIACGVYFGILLLMFLFQSRMFYFPTSQIVCTPADLKLEFEDLTLTTSDGVKIDAWYVPAKTPGGTVIFCHGNGGNLCYSLDVVENFNRMNYNVMMFDYRGYGKSEGSTTEKGTYADAQA
ncbi:MAG: alpha/beta fold hydrolase, partial [Victivallales bacterium]